MNKWEKRIATSIRKDEVSQVAEMAKELKTSWAGVLRAALRFAMSNPETFKRYCNRSVDA